MTERGISMSAPMMLAYLAGLKGETRRLMKVQQDVTGIGVEYIKHATRGEVALATYDAFPGKGTARWGLCECPYGVPGDSLYFREAWRAGDHLDFYKPSELEDAIITYEADGSHSKPTFPERKLGRYRHARFMCRWMSRVTVPILDIRAERLQDITEEGAINEGVERHFSVEYPDNVGGKLYGTSDIAHASPVESYRTLWESINGPGSWERDMTKFVWVLKFPKFAPLV